MRKRFLFGCLDFCIDKENKIEKPHIHQSDAINSTYIFGRVNRHSIIEVMK